MIGAKRSTEDADASSETLQDKLSHAARIRELRGTHFANCAEWLATQSLWRSVVGERSALR